ncbi:MAG: YgiQ family radical SAM protein [Elusimicrobia bacterium GWA2_61_42]|nr:MAG: YgiQ family radical SAM protein [Elusimicrobia bacterium GWA2_61_42]OGR75887.1 MAG: YgiQ family radical SAM protein [Elusimicrobia bacterium GWC2_61_25]
MEFLPMTPEEVKKRGWDAVDVVLITGDAYVDHPSFAMALVGRVLEAEGLRVAILSQPGWENCADFRKFGRPRLFFGVSAGNMDSMINKYTHNRKIRSTDEFSPGAKPGLRPDRATIIYSQRAREAYPDVPIVAGGIEATMRRFAHYDYWSDKVRKSVLLDSKADLLVYGMGERQIREIAARLKAGEKIPALRDIRGTAYPLGAKETAALPLPGALELPSAGEVAGDRVKFSAATRIIYEESNPYNAKPLVQKSEGRAVVQNPPALPLTTEEMDAVYGLPFTKRAHPSYKEPIPALEMIKDSIVIHRGCFGGCSFCSLTLHQGRFIQSRSPASVEREAEELLKTPRHPGNISDLGAPSANMYEMRGRDLAVCQACRKISCVHPVICPNLDTDHKPLLALMRRIRAIKGLKKAFVASGIRMDLALRCGEYISEIARFHTGGQLKVAPEHISPKVLSVMKKPSVEVFKEFADKFLAESKKAGKEQYLVLYFISAHPGSTLADMADLAVFLKERNIRPQQINDFLPAPMELATSIYFTGLDPFTLEPVYVPKKETERRMQRALLQYYKPENKPLILKALREINRADLARKLFH